MGSGGDLRSLLDRWIFISDIYRHYCNAEDEIIFSALDARVKNVACTYSLEHKGERSLHLSCIRVIQTSLTQHMLKEEEQVFPLLVEKFSFKEQATLVWQFVCSVPVYVIADFLPWLSSSITTDERRDMYKCLCKVIPEKKLLRQVILTWMDGKNKEAGSNHGINSESLLSIDSGSSQFLKETNRRFSTFQSSKIGKRKLSDSEIDDCDSLKHPINEILHWHNAIKRELQDIAKEARKIQHSGDFSNLAIFNTRLQFIADVCIFHSIAEDQIIFPAVGEVSFVEEHAAEESQFNTFRILIENMQKAGVNSTSVEFYSKLCSHADQIMDTIEKHFNDEEAMVLPSARLHFSHKKQRELLYRSICVIPLKLLERILPWLVASLNLDDARSFLRNMKLAAASSDSALVTLLCGWACKGRSNDFCKSSRLICLPSEEADCSLSMANMNDVNEVCSRDYMPCPCQSSSCFFPLASLNELSLLQEDHYNRPVKCTHHSLPENKIVCKSSVSMNAKSCNKNSCCIPDLGVSTGELVVNPRPSAKSLYNFSAPSFNSSLFLWETKIMSSISETTSRPIDSIFKFHLAIRKDLEYLDVESGKLVDCDESFLRNFSGRFRLLWGLYRAHSNAEDDIVFPALESKESLHNVSQSYTIDHKQEEKLFEEISKVLSDLSHLHESLIMHKYNADSVDKPIFPSCDVELMKNHNELARKLQDMCKSIRVSLDHHVIREELELWPLFDKHFSVEEQDKILGRIIGTTGAEVLQSMLPWVTSALTQEEQNKMMDTWRKATKNTMFDEWLNGWWKGGTLPPSQASSDKNLDSQENVQESEMFKAGWKDIFRMNQNELESEIHKVSRDSTLDPRRKAYLIQNLMTSRWIASQQNIPQESDGEKANASVEYSPSYRDSEKHIYGCEHYKRNCKLVASCCNKLYTCRFCHDEVSDHSMDRKLTIEMMCMQCLVIQPIGPTCTTPSCHQFTMAKYYCSICKFFDDERMVYHCPSCNLCRVGKGLGIDFFHCMTCNCCLGMDLLEHKCREKGLETNCPICCDFLFTSSTIVRSLPCGHFMHSSCFQVLFY
ncbi:hypothetical protein ZOSMA_269G00160 [Zostera marina]|uniref:Zinc finger protein n=1 Tax=Zostera marina TaxID=29655 RepID=A0A0K9PGQ8_ZOSMR|nr:hypothetical protein ZOSMA_269G00160 [Zostera marina]